MPVTRLEVFNNALSLFHHRLLTSDLEDSEEGRQLRAHWGSSVRFCLERGAWSFAEEYSKISPVAVTDADPTYGFDQSFEKPADWVSSLCVSDCDNREVSLRPEEYRDSGGRIWANADILHLWYVSESVKDTPGRFTQSFSEYVSADLATRVIGRLAPSASKLELLKRDVDYKRQAALSFNARQSPPQRYPQGRIVRARRGYGRMSIHG